LIPALSWAHVTGTLLVTPAAQSRRNCHAGAPIVGSHAAESAIGTMIEAMRVTMRRIIRDIVY
jgi:hypothetical protein